MEFLKPALTLLVLAAVFVFFVSLLYEITREPVLAQQIARQTNMIAELLPGTAETEEEAIEGSPSILNVISGFGEDGALLGYTVTASAAGYAGAVQIMAGFDTEGVLTGVRILNHRETPGLGTAIENMTFLTQFEGRTEEMTVSRLPSGDNEIAALASATISTTAVVNGVNAAMDFIRGRQNGSN